MTKTAYVLGETALENYDLDFISDNFENIFEVFITKKRNIKLLKTGASENDIQILDKYIGFAKRKGFLKRDYLFSTDILSSFGLLTDIVDELNMISNDLMVVMDKFYGNKLNFDDYVLKKIEKSFQNFKSEVENNDEYLKEVILFYLFKKRESNASTFFGDVEAYIQKNLNHLFSKDTKINGLVIDLIQSKYILTCWGRYAFPTNSFYKSKMVEKDTNSYKEYMSEEFPYKEVILKKINGYSDERIARVFGVREELIRDKQNHYSEILKDTDEVNKYKYVFELFDFSEKSFTYLFDEPKELYNFLCLVCKKGNIELTLKSMHGNKFFNDLSVPEEKILKFNEAFVKKEKEENSEFDNFMNFLKEYHAMNFMPETLIAFYNHYSDDKLSLGFVEKEIQSLKNKNLIRSKFRRFRYYDYEKYLQFQENLKEVVNNLNQGWYSTYKLFNDYRDLMNKMDIKNSYELHDYLNRNLEEFPKLKMLNSPEFIIGIETKNDFIKRQINEFKGNGKSEFASQMSDNFGLLKDRVLNFVNKKFKDTEFINSYDVPSSKHDETFVDKIKELLTDDVYLEDKFETLVKSVGQQVTPELTSMVGYQKTGDAYYSSNYYSLIGAIRNILHKSNFEPSLYQHLLKSKSVRAGFRREQEKMNFFQIDRGSFCTIESLNESNIDKKTIFTFIDSFKKNSDGDRFFSVHSVMEKMEDDLLVNCYFSDVFYDDIINFDRVFHVVKRDINGSIRIYSDNFDDGVKDLIKYELDFFDGKTDLDDFIDHIKNKYGSTLAKDTITENVGYYAKAMNYIYNNKEDYFNDIYGG